MKILLVSGFLGAADTAQLDEKKIRKRLCDGRKSVQKIQRKS